MNQGQNKMIIYETVDGKAKVTLWERDGQVWMNQKQMAELFDTSVTNVNIHISNILSEKELNANSVIKDYLITATYGKNYNVTLYYINCCCSLY